MSGARPLEAVLIESGVRTPNQEFVQLALFTSAGAVRIVPSRAAARADLGALTSAQITGGEDPTQAEFNALQADVAAMRIAFNDLLAKMRTANQLAT